MSTEIRPQPGPQVTALESKADILIYGGQAGGGKRLRVDEPIPTPTGWTTMGQLQVGDIVFDADGQQTKVVFVSPIVTPKECFRFVFDDGNTIESDAEHQWVTLDNRDRDRILRCTDDWRAKRRAKRPSRSKGTRSAKFVRLLADRNAAVACLKADIPPRRGQIRTTKEIAETLTVRKRINHSIVNADPIKCIESALPIPPYTLGAWLGAGTSVSGGFTGVDPEITERIEQDGFVITHNPKVNQDHYIRGLKPLLRSMGLLGSKHIPPIYLRASINDRIELLKGLCDTDGTATDRGAIEFTTTSEAIKTGFMELVASLGIKPSCSEGVATLNGIAHSRKWRIKFLTAIPCFHLKRKAIRQKTNGFRGTHSQRYIVSADRCEPSPMRCITVDSPSGTYLASRAMIPTHNTWLLCAEPLRRVHNAGYRAVIFRRTYPQIMGGGGLWEEANELYRPQGAKMREGSELDATFPSGANVRFRQLQYENTKYEYQGHQYTNISFDELTHFTESQFFYLMSRNRSTCGIKPYIRATCNPDAGSWVAKFIEWWIGEDGYPIPERTGVLRYFVRKEDDTLHWADSKHELQELYPHIPGDNILSVTFVPATLDDNKILMERDPGYKAKLMSLPRIERLRLLGGNWRVTEGSIIDMDWLNHRWAMDNHHFVILYQGNVYRVPVAKTRRFATIDTAGTSKEKAAAAKQGSNRVIPLA